MSNMSYCRFENTARDLSDCEDNLLGKVGRYEVQPRLDLIETCRRIVALADANMAEIEANFEDDADDEDEDNEHHSTVLIGEVS